MKTIIHFGAAAAAAATFSSAQALEAPKTYGGFGIGAFTIADDEVTMGDGSATTNDISTRVGLSALIGHRMTEFVALEGEVGVYTTSWDGFDNGALGFTCNARGDEECLDQMIRTVALTGNIVLSGDWEAAIRPYAGVGAGMMITTYNLEDVDAETGFGYIAKAGTDLKVGETTRIGGQYTYLGAPNAALDDIAEFSVSGHAFMLTAVGGF